MIMTCTIRVTGFIPAAGKEVAFMLDMSGCRYGSGLIVDPKTLDLDLSDEAACAAGVSLLEVEATGLAAIQACERMNLSFGNAFVMTGTEEEKEAVLQLFEIANVECTFSIEPVKRQLKAC